MSLNLPICYNLYHMMTMTKVCVVTSVNDNNYHDDKLRTFILNLKHTLLVSSV